MLFLNEFCITAIASVERLISRYPPILMKKQSKVLQFMVEPHQEKWKLGKNLSRFRNGVKNNVEF